MKRDKVTDVRRMVVIVVLLFITGFMFGTFTYSYFSDAAESSSVGFANGLFNVEFSGEESSPVDLGQIDPGEESESFQLKLKNKGSRDARIYRIVLYPSETESLSVYNNVIMTVRRQMTDGTEKDVVSKRTSNFIEICGLKAGCLDKDREAFVLPGNEECIIVISFKSMTGTAKFSGMSKPAFHLKFYAEQIDKEADDTPYMSYNDFLMTDSNWAAFLDMNDTKNELYIIKPDNFNVRNTHDVVSFKNMDTQETIILYFRIDKDGKHYWDSDISKYKNEYIYELYKVNGTDRGFILYPGTAIMTWKNILVECNINGTAISIPVCLQ